ncbi:MAG TPA: pitrilysin family protein, partial [Fimbriimonas sp.]|nr:pitrilysin family protein [Fimbriimonas sp.]
VLNASVFYPIGTMSDAKPGAIYMAAELMLRGANGLNSESFSAQLDSMGASIFGGASKRATSFGVEVPISSATKALSFLAGVVSAPTLNKTDFDQLKEEVIAQLQQENDNAGSVARKVSLREFLGANHPYAKPDSGTLAQVKALTYEDIKKASSIIRAVKPKVFVASGLPIASSKSLVDTALGGVKLGTVSAPTYPVPALPESNLRVVIVDRPKAVQSVINILFPALNNSTNEFRDLDAVRVVSGGSFTSRLNQNLREKRGYTYGAGSRLGSDPNIGWFTMQSSVRADVTGASLTEFLAEIARLEQGDITDKEASKAAEIIRTELVTSYSTLGDLVGGGIAAETSKITASKVDEILAYLKTLNSDKLNSASKKFLRKSDALIVIVGDKAEILKQIEGLGLPTPKIVSAD